MNRQGWNRTIDVAQVLRRAALVAAFLSFSGAAALAQQPPVTPAVPPAPPAVAKPAPPATTLSTPRHAVPIVPPVEGLADLAALPDLPAVPQVPVLAPLPALPPMAPLPPLPDLAPLARLADLAELTAHLGAWRDEQQSATEKDQETKQRERERAREQKEREREARDRVREREEEKRDREQERIDRETELYENGSEAIEEGRYERAAERFGQVAEMKGKRADAALYWRAYALHRLGRKADALVELQKLQTSYPQSRWLKDAKALEGEVRQSSGQPLKFDEEDCELKAMALNSLMQSDPDQAVPTLEKFLRAGAAGCPKLPEKALFVLAQSRSERARTLLASIARGESNPDLQRRAIKYLSLHGGAEARKALADIYAATSETDIKREILQAYMIGGDRERVLAAARGEKDPELRRKAIQLLGVMGARAELWQMYQQETVKENRAAIIQSMFVGSDYERMAELAKAEKDSDLRRRAIRNLGLMGGKNREATGNTLVTIYNTDKDEEVREAVIQALFLQNNAAKLVELAKTEKDPEMKRAIVQKLSIMRSKEATEYLMELLNKP